MEFISIVLLAIGLAMDAFAVSICKGLALKHAELKHMIIIGLWFGIFQAVMPIIGYFLGNSFYSYISEFDHWIAFALLVLIGANMIRESLSKDEEEVDDNIGFRTMLILAIATSIDALAVGISLAMDNSNIYVSALIIGVITMVISMVGVKIGAKVGSSYGNKAEFFGGAILILLGIKIVLEHLGVI